MNQVTAAARQEEVCATVHEDGAPCGRPRYGLLEWCKPCRKWSLRHGGASPNGRPRTMGGTSHTRCSTTGCVNPRLRAETTCGACKVWALAHPESDLTARPGLGTSSTTCTAKDCGRPVVKPSYGWCGGCYQWSAARGWAHPDTRVRPEPTGGRCTVVLEDGTRCPKDARRYARMCSTHENRKRRHGSPLVKTKRAPGELQALVREAAKGLTDECIIVTGFRTRPVVKWNGKSTPAARAVWITAHGPEGTEGMDVCHRCGGGSGENGCINVRHLYLGTRSQNAADMVEAGRGDNGDPKGQRNGRHVLTEADVLAARRLHAEGNVTLTALAERHGVTVTTMRMAVRGITWRHLNPLTATASHVDSAGPR